MKKFADIYIELEQEPRFQRRLDALVEYFQNVSEVEGAIALSFMMGFKNKSLVKKEVLAELACEAAQIQSWMFEECLNQRSNYLDTVSMIVPRTSIVKLGSLQESLSWLESLKNLDVDQCKLEIVGQWKNMDLEEKIVINPMLCGVFKLEVSFDELTSALALSLGIDKGIIAMRLSKWKPMISSLDDLFLSNVDREECALPEVFHQRRDWLIELENLLNPEEFHAKWVFDGIDVQVVKRNGEIFIWGAKSRLFWNRFPEIESYFLAWDVDLILYGTLVGWSNDGIDKVVLQKRESKKNISSKIIADFPVRFIVSEVRQRKINSLETELVSHEILDQFFERINKVDSPFIWNEEIQFNAWDKLFELQSRQMLRGSLGLEMSPFYKLGVESKQRNRYFKKNEPHSLNLILLYVKSGSFSGDKSGEEYTFGVRHESTYIPITRVASIQDEVDRAFIKEFVKVNTLEKFGPVRNVKPELVFKISFASVYLNERKKSGVELVHAKVICRMDQLDIDGAHQMQDVLELLPKA